MTYLRKYPQIAIKHYSKHNVLSLQCGFPEGSLWKHSEEGHLNPQLLSRSSGILGTAKQQFRIYIHIFCTYPEKKENIDIITDTMDHQER